MSSRASPSQHVHLLQSRETPFLQKPKMGSRGSHVRSSPRNRPHWAELLSWRVWNYVRLRRLPILRLRRQRQEEWPATQLCYHLLSDSLCREIWEERNRRICRRIRRCLGAEALRAPVRRVSIHSRETGVAACSERPA